MTQIHLIGSGQASFGASWDLAGVADINGDTTSDLIWQQQASNLVEVHFLSRTTTLGGGAITNSPFDSSWTVKAVGDFNGDGKADLIWQRASDGSTEIQFLNGNNAIGGGAIANSPFDANWKVAGAGDFNTDGTADLVYRNLSGTTTEVQFLSGTTPIGGGVIASGS